MQSEEVAAIFRRNMSNLVSEAASRERSRAAHPAFDGPRPILQDEPAHLWLVVA